MAVTRESKSTHTAEGIGLTRTLAERAAQLTFDDLPADVVEWAKHCLLDWMGVAIAGASEPVVQILVDDAVEQSPGHHTIVARPELVNARAAALINGAAAHALDYDDVHPAFTGHTSAPLAAALLALSQSRSVSGQAFIAAFVAGFETSCRIGTLVSPSHYDLGFHATSTVGTIGAAVACAHLRGLDSARTAQAMGIAATQASGLKSMFGTMCKPLHAGMAAERGMIAASLAARRFGSRDDALECDQGFARTLSGDFNVDGALDDPPGGFHIRNNLFKYHAACYLTHAAVECAMVLRRDQHIAADAIEEAVVTVNPDCDRVCNIAEPTTGLEAKFSLRMMAALALAGVDTAATATYTGDICHDRNVTPVRDRTRVEFAPELSRMQSRLRVRTSDGCMAEAFHDAGIAATDLDEQRNRLESKFRSLVEPVSGGERVGEIARNIWNLEGHRNAAEMLSAAQAR